MTCVGVYNLLCEVATYERTSNAHPCIVLLTPSLRIQSGFFFLTKTCRLFFQVKARRYISHMISILFYLLLKMEARVHALLTMCSVTEPHPANAQ